jgi:hypothetical protein
MAKSWLLSNVRYVIAVSFSDLERMSTVLVMRHGLLDQPNGLMRNQCWHARQRLIIEQRIYTTIINRNFCKE